METSPDYGDIANEAIKGRSRERRAAIEAEAQIHKTGLSEMAKQNVYKQDAELTKDLADIKRPAKRMAGIVGAAGTIAGGFVLKKGADEAKAREEKWDKRYEERMRLTEEALSRPTPKPPEIEKPPQMPNINFEGTGTGSGSGSGSGGGASSGSGSSVSSAPVNVQAMYTYMTKDKGMSHQHAVGLLANIERESGFKPGIASGDDGGPGGLFQWKGGRQTPTVARLVQTGDWKGQIDYALTEANEPGQQYLSTNFSTGGDAAAFWTRRWERPADPEAGILRQNNWIRNTSFQ